MKAYGIAIAEGANITNLAVATGTSFPSNPDEGELFFRTDIATTTKGLYCYIGGSWDRIASADSLTAPVGAALPGQANPGDLFYKNSNDGTEGLYAYNDSAWVAVSGATTSFTISGDVSGTIDGGTDALTLATVNSNVGSFGNASSTISITVNAKGLVTAASAQQVNIDAAQVISGTFANARIAQSSVTQHQAALSLAASQTTSGTFADARISQSSITQHQGALAIAESQITDSTLLSRNAGNETISGSWTFNNPIVSADPSAASHLTTKQYVDSVIAGLSWKNPVRVATTANITLSGTQTVDGAALVVGNRVLVKNQTAAADNGIYVVASGTWTRATDFDSVSPIDEINSGAVFVTGGNTYADTAWTQVLLVTTVGVDSMSFVQFSASGAFTAGSGLTLSGNTFNIGTVSTSRIVVNVDDIDLATVADGGGGSLLKFTRDSYGRVTGTSAVATGDLTGLLNSTYVNVTGDTMTGDLAIAKSNPNFVLNAAAIGDSANIYLATNSSNRWRLGKDTAAESGSNTGSGFFINSIADDGSTATTRMSVNRATGAVNFPAADVFGGTFTAISDSQPLRTQLISSAGYGGVRVANQAGTRVIELISIGSTATAAYGMAAGSAGINTTVGCNFNLSVGDTQRMIVDASTGNFGIGGSPANRLDVFHGVTGIGARVRHTGTGVELAIRTDAATAGLDAGNASGGMTFSINTSEKMRLGTNGNFSIGATSTAVGRLAVENYLTTADAGKALQRWTHVYNSGANGHSLFLKNTGNFGMVLNSDWGARLSFGVLPNTGSDDTTYIEHMTILANGNVSIGNTSDGGGRLNIITSATAPLVNFNSIGSTHYLRFQTGGTSIADIGIGSSIVSSGGSASDFGINSRTGSVIVATAQAERMRVLANGRVLISRTTDSGLGAFQVAGVIDVSSTNSSGGYGTGEQTIYLRNTSASSGARGAGIRFDYSSNTGGAAQIDLVNGASNGDGSLSIGTRSGGTISERLAITGSGITVTGTVTETSTIRVKENIRPLKGALETVIGLRGVMYDMKDHSASNQIGLIAEEVQKVLPNVVYRDEEGEIAGVQYARLVAVLIESVKEQEARIKTLEAKLAKLVD